MGERILELPLCWSKKNLSFVKTFPFTKFLSLHNDNLASLASMQNNASVVSDALLAVLILKTTLTADEIVVHLTYGVKLIYHKIETSLSTDEF